MKKNRTMRVAAVLLALTLITSCFVGGTFAKYVTNGTGSDSARVAKFGVTVTANGETFAETYAKEDGTEAIGANSVVSADGDVVAPGTKGDMVSMTLAGTPEVAVKVTYVGTLDLGDNWMVDGAFYCPITITVNDEPINGTDYESADEFEAAVKAVIDGYSKEYAAGTDLSAAGADSLKISWAWTFEGDNDKDTKLGNAETAATISLSVDTTVTQID